MSRPVVDVNPNGKWRIGSTIGMAPKGHDCILEGFVVRKGKTVKEGTVTYIPSTGKQRNFILRNNDIE